MSRQGSTPPRKGEKDKWIARDIRETGAKPRPCKVKPQPKKLSADICGICYGSCCGTSCELIAELFGMGRITVSPKVSRGDGENSWHFVCILFLLGL